MHKQYSIMNEAENDALREGLIPIRLFAKYGDCICTIFCLGIPITGELMEIGDVGYRVLKTKHIASYTEWVNNVVKVYRRDLTEVHCLVEKVSNYTLNDF